VTLPSPGQRSANEQHPELFHYRDPSNAGSAYEDCVAPGVQEGAGGKPNWLENRLFLANVTTPEKRLRLD